MKKSLLRVLAVVLLAIACVAPAQARILKVGPRVGVAVNKLHFNEKTFDSDNRAGFTAGLEAELTIPLVGLGLDASVMYVRRSADFMQTLGGHDGAMTKVNRDYIDVPVYLKWKIGVPVVGNIVKPFLFTGPDFAFLTSGKAINEAIHSKKVDTSWNVGLGVEFVSHLQVSASYGFGLGKAAVGTEQVPIEGKNRYWTVTAAWLF